MVRVTSVVDETADAVSFVIEPPDDHATAFSYEAGQFVTVRVTIDGAVHHRSYSMSSSPAVDADLRITVKRVPGGLVSNWLIDHIGVGHRLTVSAPSGGFVASRDRSEIVAFAAGSGITPVFSIITTALSTTTRAVRLLYANKDGDAAIFRDELDDLVRDHSDRLTVEHHFDDDLGYVTARRVQSFTGGAGPDAEHFVCGPAGFMRVVEDALADLGVSGPVHVERFAPDISDEPRDVTLSDDHFGSATAVELTISCGGRTVTVDPRSGHTILQSARAAGLRPPSSCETGSCATCMAMVVDGSVEMRHNEVLTDEEVAEGWVVTCQALPASPSVRVVYE